MSVGERIDRDGMAAFQRAAPSALAAACRIEVAEIGGAACGVVRSQPALTLTNRVPGLGLDAPVTAGVLDEVGAFFGAARYVVSGNVPDLEARGFARGTDSAVFERGVAAYEHASNGLEVVEAGVDTGTAFGELCGEASGTPPFLSDWFGAIVGRDGWHCFFAVDAGTPVATAAFYAADDGGWLGFGATLVQHRRRGAQNALLAARIDRARELGLTMLVASTTAGGSGDSYRNIERAGFRLARLRQSWVSPA
jgi:GNAT superfamily N-acetyltransferase